MGLMNGVKGKKIILVPYPSQGHVTPMVKLAIAFQNHGLEPILITPESIHTKITSTLEPLHANKGTSITFMSIPDGIEKDVAWDFFGIEEAMENHMPTHLESIVRELDGGGGVACLVVDLLASWAIEVARRCGVPVAGFWPAMLACYRLISAIPDMVTSGLVSETGIPQHQGSLCFLPNQPLLSTEHLPWLIGTPAARRRRFKFWTRTLHRARSLSWLVVNSFPREDTDTDTIQYTPLFKNVAFQPKLFQVGVAIKHALRVKNPSFWEEDLSCLRWLDTQKPSSVVYISFGSWVSPIGEGKLMKLALALEAIGQPFIWALGVAWRKGLPEGYLDRVSKFGRVVTWAPQVEILKHNAVGCYLSHCGWNSTVEAIQCRKRLLCYPVAGDQFLNCAYIVEKWKVGVCVNGFGKMDLEESLWKLMDDDEIEHRLRKLHERTMGEEAELRVMENITAFVDNLEKPSE